VKGELRTYRKKRDPARTPEPVPDPEGPLPTGNDDTFVVQEHHARRLHWDFRLERGGVLVSWAVPRGLPLDPKTNHLAVHTEDHPLSYAGFAGEIPKGEYGGGAVSIWDRGTYVTEKWSDDEVKIVLSGSKVSGRYVLFRTRGDDWMMHRMDPSPEGWSALPELVRPMLATTAPLPPAADDDRWAYEMKWDGVRAVAYISGGRVRFLSRNDRDVSGSYPELRGLGDALASHDCILDGEIVAFDENGRVSFGALQSRMHVADSSRASRLAQDNPASYFVFDVLHLHGRDTTSLSYDERRDLLESLAIAGPRWQVPPHFPGSGAAALATSRAQGLEGVVGKRRDSSYLPGRRSPTWIKVKHVLMQEVVIGGWQPGEGRRAGGIGALLLGVQDDTGLRYAGQVGTGFTEAMLADLARLLRPLARKTSPFVDDVPRKDARDAHWVTPRLVGEVAYGEWTREGRLRHASWRGLRIDKDPADVRKED
jgi:bifunctional non-homologous end joining protein LigD